MSLLGPNPMAGFASLRVLILDGQELAALGAARSLGRAGHRVVIATSEAAPGAAAAWSRFVAGALQSPDPWRRHGAFIGWLRALLGRERFDVVLPISEAAMAAAAVLRAEGAVDSAKRSEAPFIDAPLWLLADDASLQVALSKHRATRAALDAGLPTPRTAFLRAAGETVAMQGERAETIASALRQAGLWFPVILKSDNRLGADGVYRKGRALRVGDEIEAAAALGDLAAHGAAVIAQESVPGHGEGAFLLRLGGATLLRFAHRRLHEVPYSGGVSSLRESVHDPGLLAQAERLLGALRYQGVAMVEFRRGADGVAYFLEINGRLWGSLALALHAGVDFPRVLLDASLALREGAVPLPPRAARGPAGYPAGVRCRNVFPGEILHVTSLLASAEPRARKRRAVGEFFRLSLDPSIHHDYLWAVDPLPALPQALRVGAETLGRLLGRVIESTRDRGSRARALRALATAPPLPERLLSRGADRGALDGAQVLFLCLGNICRSPFAALLLQAEARLRGLPLRVGSAGLAATPGRATPTRIQALTAALGVDLADHRAQPVDDAQLAAADLVFVMDAANYEALLRRFPAARDKSYLIGQALPQGGLAGPAELEIPDPFMAPLPEARRSYEKLRAAVLGLADRLELTLRPASALDKALSAAAAARKPRLA